jgi:hypothetical protein
MLVFSTGFVNCCPSNLTFSLVHLPSLPPFPVWISTRVCIHTVCKGGGSGCVESIYRSWPDSEPTKLLYRPKQKPRSGGGLRQINTWPPSTFTSQFLRKPTFRVWCLYRYLVLGYSIRRRYTVQSVPYIAQPLYGAAICSGQKRNWKPLIGF